MKTKIAKFFYLILVIVFLDSCAAINVTSSSVKEKGIKEAMSDGMIDAAVNKELINHDINMFLNVEIEVVEGRVLLTGSVKKAKYRMDAIKLAWKVLGVREVINEIEVTNKGGIIRYLNDVKIKTQIRYKIIADKKIRSINYNFESVNGTLYVIGIAQNKKELKRVVMHSNDIKGVIKVVSHVMMKDDPRRKKYQRKLQKKED
jgi:osmotically-inducible protein OsmY